MDKKNVKIWIVLMCIVMVVSACSKRSGRIYYLGGLESGSTTIEKKVDYVIGSVTQNENLFAKKQMTMEIKGIEQTGEYDSSLQYPYYNCNYDRYFVNGSRSCFMVLENTDNLVEFHISTDDLEQEIINKHLDKVSYEECYNIAQEFINDYFEFGEYVFDNTKNVNNQTLFGKETKEYTFVFAQYCNGVRTKDSISVSVCEYGVVFEFRALYMYSIQDSDKKTILNITCDIENQEIEINEYIENMIKDIKSDVKTWKICDRELLKLKDGRFAIKYIIDVKYGDARIIDGEEYYNSACFGILKVY